MTIEDRVTIRDVARLSKVSKSTVSLVLNGGHGVADDTAARVRDMLARTGYCRDPSAARFRSKRGGPVAVALSRAPDVSTGALLAGLSARLQEAKLPMLLSVTEERGDCTVRYQGACALVTDLPGPMDPDLSCPVIRLHGAPEGAMQARIDVVKAMQLAARAARAAGADRLIVSDTIFELGEHIGMSVAGLPVMRLTDGAVSFAPGDVLLCTPLTASDLRGVIGADRLVVLGRGHGAGRAAQIHWDSIALGRAVGDALVTSLTGTLDAPEDIVAPVWLSMPPRPA